MTKLSVNVNKIAWLRNARGGDYPSIKEFSKICIDSGCQGITVHPRDDMRHINPEDVKILKELTKESEVEFNIEFELELELEFILLEVSLRLFVGGDHFSFNCLRRMRAES